MLPVKSPDRAFQVESAEPENIDGDKGGRRRA